MKAPKPPQQTPTEPGQIAVLQLGRLGDMILSTPLFSSLKQVHPKSHLTVIASEKSTIIARHCPAADTVIPVPDGFLQIPTLAQRLRSKRYDLFIDPKDHQSNTSRVVSELARAGLWVGHKLNASFTGHKLLLPAPTQPLHYTDRMLAPLRLLHPGQQFGSRPSLHIPDSAFGAVDRQMTFGDTQGTVVVNISAGDRSRYWDPKKWRALIDTLSGRYTVIVLYGPGQRDMADEVCPSRREAHPLRTDTIIEAAAAVARAGAVISPDTSIIHLASALNRPTVGLYPPDPDNLASFAPLANRHVVLTPPPGGTVADIPLQSVLDGFQTVAGEVNNENNNPKIDK